MSLSGSLPLLQSLDRERAVRRSWAVSGVQGSLRKLPFSLALVNLLLDFILSLFPGSPSKTEAPPALFCFPPISYCLLSPIPSSEDLTSSGIKVLPGWAPLGPPSASVHPPPCQGGSILTASQAASPLPHSCPSCPFPIGAESSTLSISVALVLDVVFGSLLLLPSKPHHFPLRLGPSSQQPSCASRSGGVWGTVLKEQA